LLTGSPEDLFHLFGSFSAAMLEKKNRPLASLTQGAKGAKEKQFVVLGRLASLRLGFFFQIGSNRTL
jgi:hypothetical protein